MAETDNREREGLMASVEQMFMVGMEGVVGTALQGETASVEEMETRAKTPRTLCLILLQVPRSATP